MIFIKILPVMLKTGLTQRNMVKKRPFTTSKDKKTKIIGFKNNERGGKTITKFATTAPKTYGYRVQKDDHEIKDSDFIKGN